MPRLRVHAFSISLDGYGAGPGQELANPQGVGGLANHKWAFATRTFQQMLGREGGSTGIADDLAARGFADIGAWIIGRNMFGPAAGALGRRELERVVGRQPALPLPGVRAHPSSARLVHHGG